MNLKNELEQELRRLECDANARRPLERVLVPTNEGGIMEYGYVEHSVDGQDDKACELTMPQDLPNPIKGLYAWGSRKSDQFATKETLLVGIQAAVYYKQKMDEIATFTGFSHKKFIDTRKKNGKSTASRHNYGTGVDIVLSGKMPSHGSGYDKRKSAFLALYCAIAGAKRIIFSDIEVMKILAELLPHKEFRSEKKIHDTHIHFDFKLNKPGYSVMNL